MGDRYFGGDQGSPRLPEGMSLAEVQALINSMVWHHSFDFGSGLRAGHILKHTKEVGEALLEGLDLRGKTLLDIGAWNGAYSFEAKRRGAKRVVASDHYAWTHPSFKGWESFLLARQLLGLDVEAHTIDVPYITPQTVGTFDVILYAGVFYHLIDPVGLTKRISDCATHLLIVETHQDALGCPRPAMIFYPGATLAGDASNWWGPNPQCMYELLKEFGFSEIFYRQTPGHGKDVRAIFHAYRNAESKIALDSHEPSEVWLSLSDPINRAGLFAPRV